MLRQAELAETAIRQRLAEPMGTVRFTAVATAQFALRELVADFLVRCPKIDLVGHATDVNIDIVGENYDIAIRARSARYPTRHCRKECLRRPWYLFAGTRYLDAKGSANTPHDLEKHSSLFMMRTGVRPIWRLQRASRRKDEVVVHLAPRLLMDDMISLKQAAIAGLGIVALPGYVCREEVHSGALRQILPGWIADDSTFTALIPYRQGLLPSVRVFLEHLTAELPKVVRM